MSDTLKQRALAIRNETVENANTAIRVGGLLTDMTDQFDTAFNNYFDFTSGSTTAIASPDTWVKLNTTTTQGFSRNGLVHSNNRITWTGATTRIFELSGIVSLQSGNNNDIHVAFFKSGYTPLLRTICINIRHWQIGQYCISMFNRTCSK
jgi:hypothetical protein